jgi:hypothetical protein
MGPDENAVRAAGADLARLARTTAKISGLGLIVAAVGAGMLGLGMPSAPFATVGGLGLMFAGLYAVALRRVVIAQSSLRDGPVRAVRAVGWCRPPDGCNYAVFIGPDLSTPDAVIRLPLRREVSPSIDGWLCGDVVPAVWGGVALIGESGLLATGRIVSRRTGQKRWQRRSVEPGRWVQRPPRDWLPPGGQ